ncbi:hypothetical protein [Neolewinella agarilytica]|uniref:hypothetical protein n=1 Tax=Neolewinella agarilytica TaxID=478744 RepID=UPI0023564278|nr:hypothetical protein [Neolewinella agarilytica]
MKVTLQVLFVCLTAGIFLISSCEKTVDTPDQVIVPEGITEFVDDFETESNDLSLLFPPDGSRWTTLQLINTAGGNNQLALTAERVSLGNQSLSISSFGGNNPLSKTDIERGGFAAVAGQTITIEADFYIDSDANLRDLLLLDLECCSCWDPTVPDNKCPGVRLLMSGGNDFLSIERGKIGGETLLQTSLPFPRREWVHVVWEMTLSPDETTGHNRLIINEQEVVTETGMNMPDATILANAAAAEGISFTLPEPVFYERLQIGVTANPRDLEVDLFVDNVRVQVRD